MNNWLSSLPRVVVPYMFPALGAWAERSGLVTICLEGAMLVGAFTYASVALATTSASSALLACVLVGAVFGLMHALIVSKLRVDAMVSGVALNAAAYGATRFGLKVLYGSSSNSPATPPHTWVPYFLGFFAISLWLVSPWLYRQSRWGLRVRAVGDAPEVAHSVGISVEHIRAQSAAFACGLAALGGAALVADLHKFQSGMSAGRGFLALVAIVIAQFRPARAATVALLFGAMELASVRMQSAWPTMAELAPALPYVLALVVIALPRRATSSL